jgi:hypothetical protein
MTQTDFIWDACASRHKGNPNSVAANLRINPHKESDRESIRIQVASQGFAGLTIKEIRLQHPTAQPPRFKYPNEFSGRLCELVADQKIFVSGRKRDNCSVYVARKEWANA